VLLQLHDHPLLQPTGVLDDAAAVRLAGRIAAGDLALGHETYYLSPLYLYFLGFVFSVTGGSVIAARIAQIVLGAAGVYLVVRTADRWFGRRASIAAGLLAAFTGVLAFNEILILQSSLDGFLTALALWALARATKPSDEATWNESVSWLRVFPFSCAGVSFGLLALNRPNALACLAVAAIWIAVGRSRTAALQSAALVAGAAIAIAPVAIRNRAVTGEWTLVASHGGLNFYVGNHEGADGTWMGVEGIRPSIEGQAEDTRRAAAAALGRPVTAPQASDYFYRLAWTWIRAHPAAWARLTLTKLALVFNAVDVGLNYSYTYFARDELGPLSFLIVGPWLLIPLGLFGLALRLRGDDGSFATWAACVPIYAVSVAAFFVSSRYRLPLLPPLAVCAGGVVGSFSPQRTQRTRSSGPVGSGSGPPFVRVLRGEEFLALAALFVFANWPLRADAGRMFERGERIVQLFEDGRRADAEAVLASTETWIPTRGLLLYRIGLVLRGHGDAAGALEYLQRAHAVDPGEPNVRFHLGEVLLSLGRAREAIPHLEAARAARVLPSTSAYDLAGAYQAIGDVERARGALASIVDVAALDPPALLRLGDLAIELEDAPLAERFLRPYVEAVPADVEARQKLATALAVLGKIDEARVVLEEARRP